MSTTQGVGVSAASVGRTIAFAAIAAILTLLGLIYGLGMDPMDAFYIAFTIGSATAAAVALTEREANIGTVASAAALLLLLGLAGPYLGLSAILTFKTETTTVYVPIEFLPWIALGLLAIFVVGYALGAPVGRLALWVLGSVLAVFWFAVTEPTSQVVIACLIALIAAVPLLRASPSTATTGLLVGAVLPAGRTQVVFDLSQANVVGMMLIPLILFVALDPFNVIRERRIQELASVVVIFIAFLQVLTALL